MTEALVGPILLYTTNETKFNRMAQKAGVSGENPLKAEQQAHSDIGGGRVSTHCPNPPPPLSSLDDWLTTLPQLNVRFH